MLYIAVFEAQAEQRKIIRGALDEFVFQTNLVHDILWLESLPSEQRQEEYFPHVCFALVSLDTPDNLTLAEALYRCNPDCRIVFYSASAQDLAPLLHTRPIGFCLSGEENGAAFGNAMRAAFADLGRSPGVLRIENRNGLYLLPCARVLYIQSELKTASVHSVDSAPVTVVRKLSELERQLEEDGLGRRFLRIHQSFIVNLEFVRSLDKREHRVVLFDGETLPVSDSRYESVLRSLDGSLGGGEKMDARRPILP